ncbi:MAG TPA: universal stress protein [Methanosarcina sp.]|nr:universal stress protein [Methanosarcina sp.]
MDSRIFENIMVATDGSEIARKAVDSAIKIAKLNKAKLYAVNVSAPGETKVTQHDPRDAEWEKHMEEHLTKQGKEATHYVETTGKILNVVVEPVILKGNPASEIANFAEKNDVELIVMGTLGKSGVQRFLLGSVAENVIRHSKVPVLVVRGEVKDNPYSQILIATDGSKASGDAAYLGIKFARQNGAKVYALYVTDITAHDAILIDEAWVTEECEACEKTGHRATSSVEEKAKFAGLEAESTILKGDPAEKILEFANEHGVDLIVVGSLGRSGIERFAIGSVAEKVVRHAKVPVLVVRCRGK